MKETNYFKVGLFITIGTLIFIGLLFMVGLRDYFESKFLVYSYTADSVQGLEEGSAVKYQGVTIGQVEEILIAEKNYVCITMSIRPSLIASSLQKRTTSQAYLKKGQSDKTIYARIKENVEHGLRCRIDYTGITGMKYIDMFYSENPEFIISLSDDKQGYIPSIQSSFADTMGNMEKILGNISNIDFAGIEKDLREALVAVKTLAANPDINASAASLNKALKSFADASDAVQKQVDSGGVEFKEMLRAAKLLLEALEEDPASIIGGKHKQR